MPTIVANRPLEDPSPAETSAVVEESTSRLPTPTRLSQRLFKPGWPLAAILVPFPLWWALGLSEWIVPAMAVLMAGHLLRQRSVLVPRGFGFWMAFLLWVTVGGLLLQVDALGAVADDSSTRLITFSYRLIWYVSITVAMLYVINTRRELSTTRVTRIVACLFIAVTLGGVLGVVSPYFEFKSPVELLVQKLLEVLQPGSSSKFQLISAMVHPQAAQLQDVLGYVAPRPSAPFTFTNTWGLNFALTLPFFLWAWLGKDAGWRRWAAIPILVVAAVPFIYSLNRGLWGACIAMALFVAARAALSGRPGVLAGVVAGAAALALLLAVSPLGDIVALRFSNKGSEDGRTNLGTLAIRSVTATSPIVGLGSTRNVQGNFQSITGGSTAQCPRCSPPSLGTQGQLWLVVFSQGLVGLALFLLFFARVFLRHIRLRSPEVTVALSSIVAWGVTLPVYNSLGSGMLVVMIAVGLLCRESWRAADQVSVPGDSSLRSPEHYLAALRSGAPVIVALTLIGIGAGGLWQNAQPAAHKATASILLSEPPRYPSPGYARTNVDTDAQLVASQAVRDAAAAASGESAADIAEHLTVTATPSTRVLHLHLTARTSAAARAGVDAATDTFVRARTKRLETDRITEAAKLRSSTATLGAAIDTLDAEVRAAGKRRDSSGGVDPLGAVPRAHRNELLPQADAASRQSARIAGLVLSGGQRTAATVVTQSSDRWRVSLVSGATAGFGLGALIALLWGAAGPTMRRVKDVEGSTGLPLLAQVTGGPRDVRALAHLLVDRPMAYVAATERDATASSMAARLTDHTRQPGHGSGAVIVASSRTRIDRVLACRSGLGLQGIPVRGLVLVTDNTSSSGQESPSDPFDD